MADKPDPIPTALTEPYWRNAAENRLVLQHCTTCGHWIHFPETRCPACGRAELVWDPVSGRGTVSTFTVVHRSFVEGFEDAPYAMAWIDLPEQAGLRVFGNITGCAHEAIRIGMPVEVWFEQRSAMTVPNFRTIEREDEP